MSIVAPINKKSRQIVKCFPKQIRLKSSLENIKRGGKSKCRRQSVLHSRNCHSGQGGVLGEVMVWTRAFMEIMELEYRAECYGLRWEEKVLWWRKSIFVWYVCSLFSQSKEQQSELKLRMLLFNVARVQIEMTYFIGSQEPTELQIKLDEYLVLAQCPSTLALSRLRRFYVLVRQVKSVLQRWSVFLKVSWPHSYC